MWENIIWDKSNIVWSILLLVIFFLSYIFFYFLKPSFVVPKNYINHWKRITRYIIILIVVIIISLLPLNIEISKSSNIQTIKTANIQILLDVSLSMTADDIKPSRFDNARDAIKDLVVSLSGYNISLITYSAIPFVYIPFSNDTNFLENKIKNMTFADFPPTIDFVWTAIWDALLLWINNLNKFSKNKENPGSIILITDGDSNKWSNPIQATAIAKRHNMKVYTIWIGSDEYLVWTSKWWEPVNSSINEDLLEEISSVAGGEYFRILTTKDFEEQFANISQDIQTNEEKILVHNYISINYYLYIILIFLSLILVYTKMGSIKD